MAVSQFSKAAVAGIAVTLGEKKQRFKDDPIFYNNDPLLLQRLEKTIGFGTRYTANKETTTCDLCIDAAQRLLGSMGLSSQSLDAVISVTQTPDYYMPGNAHIAHERLNMLESTIAVDVELGCSGFIYGLWLAYLMIETGMDHVLLLTGDTLSKAVHPEDRTLAPLFGDAGAATVVSHSATTTPSFFILKSDGSGVPKMLQPAGAYKKPSCEETRVVRRNEDGGLRCDEHIYMNGFEIFNFTLTKQPKLLQEILEVSDKTLDDIDYFFFHQGNKYIVDTIARSAKLPGNKVPITFPDYGNQNSASIPGVICATLSDGSFDKPQNVIMQGFGIGLSWGGCQVTFDNTVVLKPHCMEKN